MNSTYFSIYEQEKEVSQESILSVTLFSINRLAKVLNDNIEGFLYVDFFMICYRGYWKTLKDNYNYV